MTRSLQVATEDVVDIQYSNSSRREGFSPLKRWDIRIYDLILKVGLSSVNEAETRSLQTLKG